MGVFHGLPAIEIFPKLRVGNLFFVDERQESLLENLGGFLFRFGGLRQKSLSAHTGGIGETANEAARRPIDHVRKLVLKHRGGDDGVLSEQQVFSPHDSRCSYVATAARRAKVFAEKVFS